MDDPFAWFLIIPILIIMLIVHATFDYFCPNHQENEMLALQNDVINIINTESTEGMLRNDAWGTPVEFSYTETKDAFVAKAVSCGPDKKNHTEDDLMKSAKILKRKKNYKLIWDFLKN